MRMEKEKKDYIQRKINQHGKNYWKQEIENIVTMKLKASGFQNIDSEILENIVDYLMTEENIFKSIEWLNILISWGCNLYGISL